MIFETFSVNADTRDIQLVTRVASQIASKMKIVQTPKPVLTINVLTHVLLLAVLMLNVSLRTTDLFATAHMDLRVTHTFGVIHDDHLHKIL